MQDEFDVIAEFASPVEAEIAAGRLIADGIDARVEYRGALGTPILNPGHAGGVVISVAREDAKVATEILDSIDEDFEPEVPPEFADDSKSLECPECGSKKKKFQREASFLRVLPRSSHHPERTGHRWICQDCHHIWIVEVPS